MITLFIDLFGEPSFCVAWAHISAAVNFLMALLYTVVYSFKSNKVLQTGLSDEDDCLRHKMCG